MSQPFSPGVRALGAPRFYVTPRQRLGVGPLVVAVVLACVCLAAVSYALRRSHRAGAWADGGGGPQAGGHGFGAGSADDDDDDPSRMDTIYLGGPNEAPVANRPGGHASTVHPFRVIHLPSTGEQVGQIPDTPAGQALYRWLADFNSKDVSGAARALPVPESGSAEDAEVALREQTGGFTLVSAKEVEAGLLVFRLHDQSAAATEVLGTLRVRPGSNAASIASFSLRAVAPAPTKH